MAGKRMVYEEMCVSQKFSKVSAGAERLWTRILTKTDDHGNFHAAAALVRGLCLPQFDVTLKEVQGWVDELCNVGLMVQYEVRGEQYLHVACFSKYQTLRRDRAQTIRYPAHPTTEADNEFMPPPEDEDFVSETPKQPNVNHQTGRVTTLFSGKPSGNQVATTGMAEVKLSEGKLSEGKLSEVPGHGSSSSEPKATAADWKILAVRYKRYFGSKASTTLQDKYYNACNAYGEDIVLACFEDWVPEGVAWKRRDPDAQPLYSFFKKLPDMVADEIAIQNAEKKEQEQTRIAQVQAAKAQTESEAYIAQQKKDMVAFMEKEPPPQNGVDVSELFPEAVIEKK